MFSLKTHLILCGGLLAALIAVAAGGNALDAAGVLPPAEGVRWPAVILLFALVIAFALSAVPVMVMTTLRGQRRPVDRKAMLADPASGAEKVIIWLLWGLMIAGSAVAIPAMVRDGAFSQPTEESPGETPSSMYKIE